MSMTIAELCNALGQVDAETQSLFERTPKFVGLDVERLESLRQACAASLLFVVQSVRCLELIQVEGEDGPAIPDDDDELFLGHPAAAIPLVERLDDILFKNMN